MEKYFSRFTKEVRVFFNDVLTADAVKDEAAQVYYSCNYVTSIFGLNPLS